MKSLLVRTVALLLAGTWTVSAYGQEVVLKGVSAFPDGILWSSKFEAFVKRVNEKGAGLIRINYLGGAPKVMPPFDVGKNLREGIVDIINNTGAYYTNVMPEGDALKLLEFPMSELRKNGGWELINKIHNERMNAFYLARVFSHDAYHIYLKNEISRPDFSGLKLRVTPVYRALVEKLGGTAVTSSPAEVYTLMERNTVNGFGNPARGLFDFSLEKVTSYRIDPGFYNVDVHFLINRDAWNKLNDKQRQVLQDAALEIENSSEDLLAMQAELKKQAAAGIKPIRFSAEDEKRYLQVARDAAWEAVIKASPEYGPKLREFLAKKN